MSKLRTPTFKLLTATAAMVLASATMAENDNKTLSKKDFPLNERENAEKYNVAFVFGSGSSVNSGILGEMTLNENMTAGVILGLDGGFGVGFRLENGFKGAHKTGIFAAATGDFRFGKNRWYSNGRYSSYNCNQTDFGAKAVIGYQYLNETGFSASAGIGAGLEVYDDNGYYCSSNYETNYLFDPKISTEFSLGYNFDY